MEKVVAHTSRNAKRSMLYVARFRARSACGVFFITPSGSFSPPAQLSETSPVHLKMKRLVEID